MTRSTLPSRLLALLVLTGCADTAAPPPPAPSAADDVWLGDLMRDGYSIENETPFLQVTRYGPKTFRYLLRRGDSRWACYTMDSAVDRSATTDRRCYPYDPVKG